ncbi:unnamed protein product [Prunus armeniaca]|uniref:Uncharacterized protein n=1 Tax=Prunus armeniaca TaxID=36596 RepID=A0A6J5V6M0_PRUAR|nr:unnamed protein product [Prunus armeniaca]
MPVRVAHAPPQMRCHDPSFLGPQRRGSLLSWPGRDNPVMYALSLLCVFVFAVLVELLFPLQLLQALRERLRVWGSADWSLTRCAPGCRIGDARRHVV